MTYNAVINFMRFGVNCVAGICAGDTIFFGCLVMKGHICQHDCYRTNLELCLRQILTYHLEYAIIHQKHRGLYLIESKIGILTLSALLNTLKIPVNGYVIRLRNLDQGNTYEVC